MKKFYILLFTICLFGNSKAQFGNLDNQVQYFNPNYAPFYHGVASGDPLSDRVIIWTRITLDSTITTANVDWFVATDTGFTNIINSGTFTTDASRDYTVKADVSGLSPNTTYFYVFKYGSQWSLTGRTKTAPIGSVDHLKFAVVSCSNYEAGFFNAYRRIASRNDLDAVLHLGDYIYEYELGAYGDTAATQRYHDPIYEIVKQDEYRTRYSLYRLDSSLIRAHQMHPFITVWDDHESANDAYIDGAENHDSTNVYNGTDIEGSWKDRKIASREAYFEWLPIRESGFSIYRTINYGDLADLIMIDTRIEGRSVQPLSIIDANFNDPRDLLGSAQKSWMINEMSNSQAKWKIIGNQIIFAPLNVGFAAGFADGVPDLTNFDSIVAVESIFLDIWDGYPAERKEIVDSIVSRNIDNVVFLTGDFHSSFAFDVSLNPVIYPIPATFYLPVIDTNVYNPATGFGSAAVEFATPSITSANFDENVGAAVSAGFEFNMNNPLEIPPTSGNFFNYNPHMKFTDLDQHGYFVLDIKEDSVTANYYFVDDILNVSNNEAFEVALRSLDGENHLVTTSESAPKSIQQQQPPLDPRDVSVALENEVSNLAVLGLYPNPSGQYIRLFMALNSDSPIKIELLQIDGRTISTVYESAHKSGMFEVYQDVSNLENGMYFYRISSNNGSKVVKFIKE